ncbi:MAG: YitT family protein [Solobacterium sp.]|nr:YitT family protein [Solobacterium sp.]
MQKNICRYLLFVILGTALYALTVVLFLLPADLATGGTTGIALALRHIVPISMSGFVLVFNLVMLAAGWLILGKTFALTTVLSSLTYPLALSFFQRIFDGVVLTDNPLLCTVYTGLGIGASLAIVIRQGASTGGMDIPPLVLQKLYNIPVSVSLYVFDCMILLLQALFLPAESVLYGIINVLIYSLTLDHLLVAGTSKTEVRVVSEHHDEIRQAILHQMDRGVTLYHARGGYSKADTEIVASVVSNRELPQLEQLIHDIDPYAFMVVSKVTEVSGRGFTLNKKYR